MKNYIVIIYSILILSLVSCTDGFDENIFQKNYIIANGNEIIKTERMYGDKGGAKLFYGIFLSNEKSMYYYGVNGIDNDLFRGRYKVHYYESNYIVGKINELGDIAWEQTFNDDNWIGGIVQNSRNDLYVYGQKYENDEDIKYIANVSQDGTIKELNTNNLPALNTINSMKYIDNDLFLLVGTDSVENNYLIIVKLSGMTVTVVKSMIYGTNTDWEASYVEQLIANTYDVVLTGENEKSQLIARKIRISNSDITTLWEQTITSDIMQNSSSNLTSSCNYTNNQAVKIDNEICIIGYGENDMDFTSNSGYKWKRGLVANLNYDTGEFNWLQTIPYKNPTVGDVRINSILYLDNNFYVIGQYNALVSSVNKQQVGYGFVQRISQSGNLFDIRIFGNETADANLSDGIILNKKLFLFGYKGRSFKMDFPYPNLMINSEAYQAWFISCNINDF
ncbi:MAG: hypothetical protein FWD60_02770 [Candidatus Azobacteroides sp.]|nr:hypothetical protein [Candidatus Azobacteroides sp.]